jgi:plastocyanin
MRRTLLFFVLALVLAGCSAAPRKAVSSIEVVISDYHYAPAQWRIPGGELITLKLTNESAEEHEWVLLKNPPSEPFSSDDEANIIYRVTVGAKETREVQFKAPIAPGEYSAACSKAGHMEKGETGKVLVVQPGY